MRKLAIFDMDGTLLDTLQDLAACVNHVLAKKGYPRHEAEIYKDFIGHGPLHLLKMSFPPNRRDDKTIGDAFLEYAAYYALHDQDYTKPYPGVVEALHELKRMGVKIAVYSNKHHKSVVSLCERYFPNLIDAAVGFKNGVPPKPDPTAGLAIMRMFASYGDETVYIGDSGVDMETGRALSAYTVGVSWGFRPKSELVSSGASVIIDNPAEILNIFENNA